MKLNSTQEIIDLYRKRAKNYDFRARLEEKIKRNKMEGWKRENPIPQR